MNDDQDLIYESGNESESSAREASLSNGNKDMENDGWVDMSQVSHCHGWCAFDGILFLMLCAFFTFVELAEIPLGELQQLREKIGTKKFDIALQKAQDKRNERSFKRANKNRCLPLSHTSD